MAPSALNLTSSLLTSCILANLPGPPGITFEGMYFQTYPINRQKCPDIDVHRDIIYTLHTRQNENGNVLQLDNDHLLSESMIDFSRPTVIFFHGWLESSRSDDSLVIKNAFLEKGDYNVILVDIQRLLAGPWYLTSANNVKAIGEYSAKFICYLKSRGLNLQDLTVIGMSLGGQITGNVGSNMACGKLSKIIGLDPAGPGFKDLPLEYRLDKTDAEFVVVIHSHPLMFGYPDSIGHVDLWVNDPTNYFQPGCTPAEILKIHPFSISQLIFCSHYRAYLAFGESVNDPTAFLATQCDSWKNYREGGCDSNAKIYLGPDIDRNAAGDFFFRTKAVAPYGYVDS